MSLAVGGHKGKQTYIYAGINSSPAEVSRGTNQHLRTLAIETSKGRSNSGAKATEVKVSELSRSALFANPDEASYQRLIRVSGGAGAAASAFSKDPQIAIFDTTGTTPKPKGVLELPKDAEAIDIIQTADNEFLLVYCYKYDLYLAKIGKGHDEPQLIYTISEDEPQRPSFRSLRFLTPNFVLALANLPNRSGAVLQAFRLPSPGHEKARIAVAARIPRKIMATSLAVTNVSPPPTANAPIGDAQFIIAVGGQDSSISLYTMSHRSASKIELLYDLFQLYTLNNVHEADNISGLAFSTFVVPKSTTRPQAIKLASISLQSSIAVHSIPLKKFVDSTPRNKNAPPRPPRYVIAMKSKGSGQTRTAITLFTVSVVILAIVGQVIMSRYGHYRFSFFGRPMGGPAPIINLRSPDHQPDYFHQQQFLSKVVGSSNQVPEGETMVLYEAAHPPAAAEQGGEAVKKIQVDVHDAEVHGKGKTWDQLEAEQQIAWKQRLYDAGAWTQHMGENVFRGVLFGELAGAVGQAVGGG